jgi:hypothetical protein
VAGNRPLPCPREPVPVRVLQLRVACLGLITVASGGFRAAAITFGLDADYLNQIGVAGSIGVALLFLSAAVLPPIRSEDR